jgi:hypothetical protein
MSKPLFPLPVYRAKFPDGAIMDLSFFTEAKKPINPAGGSRLAIMLYASSLWEKKNSSRPWAKMAEKNREREAVFMAEYDRRYAALSDIEDAGERRDERDDLERWRAREQKKIRLGSAKQLEMWEDDNRDRVAFIKKFMMNGTQHEATVLHPSFGEKSAAELEAQLKAPKPKKKALTCCPHCGGKL